MHHYTVQIGKIPKLIVFHDVSTKVYERGNNQGNRMDQKSFQMARNLEPEIGNNYDAVITLSEEDKDYLFNLGCKSKITVIPPQVKILTSGKIQKKPNSLCFLGSFNRQPNVNAVQILIQEIFLVLMELVNLEKIKMNILKFQKQNLENIF